MSTRRSQQRDGVFTDAAVGDDFHLRAKAAEFGDASKGALIQTATLDAHRSPHVHNP